MTIALNLKFTSITRDQRVPRLHRFVQAPRRARARNRAVPCRARAGTRNRAHNRQADCTRSMIPRHHQIPLPPESA